MLFLKLLFKLASGVLWFTPKQVEGDPQSGTRRFR